MTTVVIDETEASKSAARKKKNDARAAASDPGWKDVAEASAKGGGRKTYRKKYAVRMTPEKVGRIKDDLLVALQEVDDLEDGMKADAKDWRAKITLAKTRVDDLRTAAEGVRDAEGNTIYTEEIEGEVYEDHVFATGTVFERSCETNEIVGNPKGRAMTVAEKQVGLPGIDKPKAGTPGEAKRDDGIVADDYGKGKPAKKPKADGDDDGER
jgi:hypothetical protein